MTRVKKNTAWMKLTVCLLCYSFLFTVLTVAGCSKDTYVKEKIIQMYQDYPEQAGVDSITGLTAALKQNRGDLAVKKAKEIQKAVNTFNKKCVATVQGDERLKTYFTNLMKKMIADSVKKEIPVERINYCSIPVVRAIEDDLGIDLHKKKK